MRNIDIRSVPLNVAEDGIEAVAWEMKDAIDRFVASVGDEEVVPLSVKMAVLPISHGDVYLWIGGQTKDGLCNCTD